MLFTVRINSFNADWFAVKMWLEAEISIITCPVQFQTEILSKVTSDFLKQMIILK